jgi:membrane protease YdiL (CAAX protease family)
LLFGLKDSFGPVNAVLIQAISSCLIHLGKPEAESIGALPFGLVLGYVALRTGSFWYGFAIHASLGVLLDLSILAWPSS